MDMRIFGAFPVVSLVTIISYPRPRLCIICFEFLVRPQISPAQIDSLMGIAHSLALKNEILMCDVPRIQDVLFHFGLSVTQCVCCRGSRTLVPLAGLVRIEIRLWDLLSRDREHSPDLINKSFRFPKT